MPWRSICLLTGNPELHPEENAALLAPAFAARGLDVQIAPIDSLHLANGRILVHSATGTQDLAACDLLWVLGFGHRGSFLDKMQLLALLPPTTRCINSIQALLSLHAKYALTLAGDDLPHPDTWAFNTAAAVIDTARHAGGRLVVKPPGGSFGNGVTVAAGGSPELAAAARALTRDGQYCLLQRWVPEVEAGEYRTLVAGGRIIGEYRRIGPGSAAANLARGGSAEPADADAERTALSLRVAAWLGRNGVLYAGIDIAGAQVLEVNIINPGGLATLARLGAGDRAAAVAEAILAASAGAAPTP